MQAAKASSAALGFALGLAMMAPARAADVVVSGVTVLSQGSVVAGKSIGQWTENWIQWGLAQPSPGDAFSDPTGAAAGLLQSPPVFNLAGIAGTMANIPQTRSFTVPMDSYILVPLINSFCAAPTDGTTPADIVGCATSPIPLISALHASIDGVAVPNLTDHLESTSMFFTFDAVASNIFGYPAGQSGIAYGIGYYLMLDPIGFGTHQISFGGDVPAYNFSVDVTDTITGVPEPASMTLLAAGLAGLLLLQRRRQAMDGAR